MEGILILAAIIMDSISRDDNPLSMSFQKYKMSLESAVPCSECDVIGVLGYLWVYLLMRIATSGHKKSHVLCSNIISMLACWSFLYTHDFHGLITYYWYDLMISFVYQDYLIILHHCVSLYGLMQCPTHPDYTRIYYAAVYLKTSDIFTHQYKITNALDLYNTYPVVIRLYQMVAIFATIVLWTYYRVYRTLVLYPFNTNEFQYIGILFHMMTLYWITKLARLLNYVAKKAYAEFQDSID